MFPFMQGGRAAQWTGLPGGRFSLGRLKEGSGYCVGAVVETRMGIRDEESEVLDEGRRGTRVGTNQEVMGGNGMRDVWVIGEGFFRGVGGVFDVRLIAPHARPDIDLYDNSSKSIVLDSGRTKEHYAIIITYMEHDEVQGNKLHDRRD